MVRLFIAALLLVCSVTAVRSQVKALTEREKIEQLIVAVEQLKDAEFIRNGTAYKAPRAAEHLRTKLKKAGSKVQTAQDFISGIASASYFSGTPYYIKFKDGRQITSKEFFQKKLKEIESRK